jgi:pyruvate dehydrogenase E2 component (dihydrolipoamide acetyltransferase)
MSDIVMPRLSDTMEEGTILRWLKHDGEEIERGEELVEIETDKANMTYESDRDGILQTVAHEGDTLAVGELIAHIGEQVPERADGADDRIRVQVPERADGAGGAVRTPAQAAGAAEPVPATATPQRSAAASTPSLGNGTPPEPAGRVKASPLARRIARETGVDLRSLTGSGPGGRIVKADVEAAPSPAPAVPSPAPAVPSPAPFAPTAGELASAKGETSIVELSRIQRTIARRMAESKATIPDFTLQADVDMQRCVELRTELKRLSQPAEGGGGSSQLGGSDDASEQRSVDSQAGVPTYNDMVVKACAIALREYPRANGSYRDGRFELHSRVNVGVAVAVDPEDPLHSALVVPTVFDADSKSLGEIARETRALAERVRNGSITPPELSGGTFTVSNLGMYGVVSSFTAIINPPQAAILAVGAVSPRAVVSGERGGGKRRRKTDGSRIIACHTMTVTLSCDHRILYGADAALFLARIRELLEEPAALTL